MEVLLNQDVPKLGYKGDIVKVKPGYFRNFLWPKGVAQILTPKMRELAEERSRGRVLKKEEVLKEADSVLKKLAGLSVTIKGKASDKGKLYGSIGEAEVVAAVNGAAKLELENEFIKMDHIKEVGEYKVKVSLGDGLEEEVSVVVEAE